MLVAKAHGMLPVPKAQGTLLAERRALVALAAGMTQQAMDLVEAQGVLVPEPPSGAGAILEVRPTCATYAVPAAAGQWGTCVRSAAAVTVTAAVVSVT